MATEAVCSKSESTPSRPAISARQPRWPAFRLRTLAAGAALGLLVWTLNNLPILSGTIAPPPGYGALLGPRGQDTAQYHSWIVASAERWAIPDYFAPWKTEVSFHVPLMWAVAKVARVLALSPAQASLALHLFAGMLTGIGLLFFLRTFTRSRRDATICLLAMLCMLPSGALELIPALLAGRTNWPWSSGFLSFVGGATSDGFLQGVSGTPTVVLGAAGALLGLVAIGRWIRTQRPADLWLAALLTGLFALAHPFEFIPVAAAGCLTVFSIGGLRLRSLANAAILALPSAAVTLFYAAGSRSGWVAIAADLNRFEGVRPSLMLATRLGAVMFLAVLLATFDLLRLPAKDFLLSVYVVLAVLGSMLPFLPWPQHFYDGLYCAAGVVLIHQAGRFGFMFPLRRVTMKVTLSCAWAVLALSLFAHAWFRIESLRRARHTASAEPALTNALAPLDEIAVIRWLRQNATEQQLALAPREHAPWITTVPMHSLASHWLFSLSYPQQRRQADRFFSGEMSDSEARHLLTAYGIHWVVVPLRSHALRYLDLDPTFATRRFGAGSLAVYEIAGGEMKPLPRLIKIKPGTYVWPEAP